MESWVAGDGGEDITMADLDQAATCTGTTSTIPHLLTACPGEQKTLARNEQINHEISEKANHTDDTCFSGSAALSALARVASVARPLSGDAAAVEWGDARSHEVIINPESGGEEQKVVRLPADILTGANSIGQPVICGIIPSPHSSLPSSSASFTIYTHRRNPILDFILGDSDSSTIYSDNSGTINPRRQGEQRHFSAIDIPVDRRTKDCPSPQPIPQQSSSASSVKLPPLSLALSLSRPTLRRPAAIPAALSSPSLFAARPSSLLASPRHSPYAHPSAHNPSSSDALRSARLRLNSGNNMLSPSPYPISSPPSHSPAAPTTPPDQTSSGHTTPVAGSPSSMSMSKRRRAPEWPSPRSYHAQAQSLSYPSHPLTTGQPPPSAFSRDLAQTLHTPAALRVPPTPAYSPAFYRSGFDGQPPSADLPTPMPSARGMSPPGGTSPRHSSHGSLARNHSPFSSAPTLTTSRLADPLSLPPTSPSPNSATSSKRQRVNLMGIPKGWVIEQLNKRAGQYWHDPSSSDVRICRSFVRAMLTTVVPIPRSRIPQHAHVAEPTTPLQQIDSGQSFHSNQPAHAVWPATPLANMVTTGTSDEGRGLLGHVKAGHSSGNGRRGSLPGKDDVVALVFPLHQDYLITQSALLRSIFAPAAPAPHLGASTSAPPRAIKGARRLPTPPGAHPAILLPLPDPASFSVLVHWLYWGDINALESALSRGVVEWQGVVKNVHYLGMDDNVKRILGKWWRKWIKTDEGRKRSTAGGSGMQSKSRWGDSDEEDEAAEELDDEDESTAGRAEIDTNQGWEKGHSIPAGDADDGGVSGLLRAL